MNNAADQLKGTSRSTAPAQLYARNELSEGFKSWCVLLALLAGLLWGAAGFGVIVAVAKAVFENSSSFELVYYQHCCQVYR